MGWVVRAITGAAKSGSRAAVLRRSEGTRFSSPSDDEVGGDKARSARSERSEQSNQTQSRSLARSCSLSSVVQPILSNICSTLPNVLSMCRRKLIMVSG